MNETSKRLEETSHLFNELRESDYDRSKFRTKLNSFISSARTITLVMQKEYHIVSGFNEWYTTKQLEMKNNELFQFFTNQRNIIQKEGSVRINVKAEQSGVTDEHGFALLPIGEEKEGKISKVDKNWKITNSFKERPNENAIHLCKKYLDELSKMVTECSSKFSLN